VIYFGCPPGPPRGTRLQRIVADMPTGLPPKSPRRTIWRNIWILTYAPGLISYSRLRLWLARLQCSPNQAPSYGLAIVEALAALALSLTASAVIIWLLRLGLSA
jgi:hypothetical protein